MTTDVFEALMAKVRAFVRPLHGEIWIGKRDGHPSLNARDMREHMAENQIVDQVTAPYRHQSMPVENTWSHDVPRSMILLHQGPGKEHLQHFLAAFLCQERASNRTVDEDVMPGLIPSTVEDISDEEFHQASDGDVGTKQVINALSAVAFGARCPPGRAGVASPRPFELWNRLDFRSPAPCTQAQPLESRGHDRTAECGHASRPPARGFRSLRCDGSLIFLHHPPSLYYGFIYFQRR
jgi:hypothetical protein